jgi:hypothetical protein
MKYISETSIKRPIGVLMISLSLMVLGGFFLMSLPVDLLPRITYPMIRIFVSWPGASPQEVGRISRARSKRRWQPPRTQYVSIRNLQAEQAVSK